MAGSSFSNPSKQVMAEVKHTSSMLSGRRPLLFLGNGSSSRGGGGGGGGEFAAMFAASAPVMVDGDGWPSRGNSFLKLVKLD